MQDADLLQMLKTDKGISSTAYDARLGQYIESAKAEIKREGITLPQELGLSDAQLVVMYAGYLWSKRNTGEAMPRMLRYALNNRLLAEKAGGNNG